MQTFYHEQNRQYFLFALFSEIYFKNFDKSSDSLMRIKGLCDFENFRPILEGAVNCSSKRKKNSKAGRPAWDPVFIFKCLVAQRAKNLSDAQFELQMRDSHLLREFLGITCPEDIPSAKTLWKYRDIFTRHRVMERCHNGQVEKIQEKFPTLGSSQAIDGSFCTVPVQRNTREENKVIKDGKGDELWNDNKHKKRHKDIDARWTKKRNIPYYGYKCHACICATTKLILRAFTTAASVHDSRIVGEVMYPTDTPCDFFADSAYQGERIAGIIESAGFTARVCYKACRGRPLSDGEKKLNRIFSQFRSRVEHAFGFIEQSMNGPEIRTVGKARAAENISLTAFVYNIFRLEQIFRQPA